MIKDLKIPRMGSVENAKLVSWLIEEGESFEEGEVLYEIETDKTTTEVEATEPGVLARQIGQPGDEFKVGDTIGQIAPPGSKGAVLDALQAGTPDDAKTERGPVVPAMPEVSETGESVHSSASAHGETRPLPRVAAGGRRISPLARRLAAQLHVDPGSIAGSGPHGKITGRDIEAAAGKGAAPANCSHSEAKQQSAEPPGCRRIVHSMRRRTIARRMTEAYAIPTLTADMEVELAALRACRARESGAAPSVLAFIAYAAIQTLLEFPQFNAHFNDDALLIWDAVNLGIAVDTDDGLVVPVIRDAHRLNPAGLSEAIAALASKARKGELTNADLEGGTFTISNPGSIGPVKNTEAILNPPQVALLGLPAIRHIVKPQRDGDGWSMAVREVIQPSLSFDHRALDGGPVVSFLNALKTRIESL